MPKVPPPHQILAFQGRKDWDLEEKVDDWGLNPQQQESYVEQYRRILAAKNAWDKDEHDYFYLRRFLRARAYDLERATAMWLAHMEWCKEFGIRTILQDFHFIERDAFVEAYPQGYHKVDKMGRPIYIQQLGRLDVNKLKKVCPEPRMLKYHFQEYERCLKVIMPICSRLAGRHLDQTFSIMDVQGVGLSSLTGETKRMMSLITGYDQDNYPEMLGHICIINAPSVFRMLWAFAKNLIDPRTQNKIEILGSNYKAAVLKWVDEENLPEWLGGKSQGSLLDDIGPWSDMGLLKQIGIDADALRCGSQRVQALPPAALPSVTRAVSLTAVANNPVFARSYSDEGSDGGGYHSPAESSADLGAGFGGGSNAHNSGSGMHIAHNSHFSSSKRYSGISHGVAEEVARRYAASVASTRSEPSRRESAAGGAAGTAPAPRSEQGGGESRQALAAAHAPAAGSMASAAPTGTLLERIAALEQSLAPYTERLKKDAAAQHARAVANGSATANGTPTAAGVAASEVASTTGGGGLLSRVQALEQALNVLVEAQQAKMESQRAEVAAHAADGRAHSSSRTHSQQPLPPTTRPSPVRGQAGGQPEPGGGCCAVM